MKYTYACNLFQLSGIENINESLSTHYLVYKIINNINGKYYIGQHKTNDPYDKYMGSGRLIIKAQEKYQLSSFTKIILFDFDNFDDMNNKERELVPLSACYPYNSMSYNLCEGGLGGEMSDETKQKISNFRKIYYQSMSDNEKQEYSKKFKDIWTNKSQNEKNEIIEKCRQAALGKNNPMFGHSCTEFMSDEKIIQWKQHISEKTSGKNNPMYGKSIKDYMSPEKIKQLKEKHKQYCGEKSPCFGTKMMYDLDGNRHYIKHDKIEYYLSIGWKPSKIELKKNRIKDTTNPAYGRKWMYHPKTLDRVYVKQHDIQKYLELGYQYGVKPKTKNK